MKKLQLLIAVLFLGTISSLTAQDLSKVSISGSVDAYYRANFNAPNKSMILSDGSELGPQAPATSFANLPGFALGMANIITAYEGEKVGFVADLVFGPRGADAVFNSTGSSNIVNQLYVYWSVTDAVTLTFGNFNTFLGYEVISPTGNFNYSTSYMFSYGPFSHTGLKADIALTDNWSLMASVMNPTDLTDFNPVGTYYGGLQLGYENDNGGTWLNLLYGDQDGKLDDTGLLSPVSMSAGSTFQIDLTTGYNVSEAVYLGINATYNTTAAGEMYNGTSIVDTDGDGAGFYGFAGYLQAAASENFSVGLRGEYFNVFNNGLDGVVGVDDAGDGNVFALTLSGNAKISENFMLIPEVRLDSMSEDNYFLNNDLAGSKSLSSFLLAAVFSF
ncbi:hypothetical protein GCM10007049_15430 [Echinicola pacifica]|uniref:Beta-barrel porin-2, OmpL-like. bbp2 n=1 Tax=Echinicola pacifica TaxID=346377 RepID=A0A918UNP3_9BACT|nr:porin [Echinicola pacifica]GGZ23408.1 hypothetical protein GCM10007049_15430 [Echinicola pacifica]